MKCYEKSSKISQVLLSSRAVTPGDPSSALFMGPAHRQSATEADFNKRIGQAGSSSFK